MQIHELNNYKGTLGSGSFIAVDNGNDTGKLSTAQLLADTNNEVIQLGSDLNARIDNIIAGGDAPSEAEIIDARLGGNGVAYPSLGDATRGQFDELLGDLTEISGNKALSFKVGKGVNTSGTVNVNSFVDSELLDCVVAPCSEGDVFSITGTGGGAAYLLYTFVNSGGTKLQSALASEVAENKELIAPANAAYLVVNAYKSSPHFVITNKLLSGEVNHNSEILDQITNKTILHRINYEYPNALNNGYVWILDAAIPAKAYVHLTLQGTSGASGSTTVFFFRKNDNGTFTVLNSITLDSLVFGDNVINEPDNVKNVEHYIGLYSNSNGIMYGAGGETNVYTRVQYADIEQENIPVYGSSVSLNFAIDLYYEQLSVNVTNNAFVTVDAAGNGDYTSVLAAMNAVPENTVIFIKPGVYEQDMTSCLEKRVILIGTDRNQCIIRDTDGRYGHHPLYVSCGYFENLTIEAPYINGTSQEIGMGLGAYAVHIDTDNDYGIGKQIEFYHCNISSDFFPAIGCGLRKDLTLIIDDCILSNGQIANRGDYSDEGSLGALYFHDSNGAQGDQYVILKNSVFKSKLEYAMCPYQVDRDPQNNRVYCDFINNVLYSEVGKYNNTVWFRGDPFNPVTGIFSIGIGYGNSIASLNN